MIHKERLQSQIEELQPILDKKDTAYDYEPAFDEIGQEVFLLPKVFFYKASLEAFHAGH